MTQSLSKLRYIIIESNNLEVLRKEARDLFDKMGHYITDKRVYEGFKNSIEEIDNERDMEELVTELDDKEVQGRVREEKEQYLYRNWPEDDYSDDCYSKV